ncbi:hypothetical protein GCM10027051_09510 [Niabella terrae]
MKHYLPVLLFLMNVSFLKAQEGWIRINQLGYTLQDVKVAVLVSKSDRLYQSFELKDARTHRTVYRNGRMKAYGAYAPFHASWRLDFTEFSRAGTYYLLAGDLKSPVFDINDHVYDGTADFILNYMRQQRSKYNPFLKDSCHLEDGFIVYHPDKSLDSTRLDVAGGWHDASDYLQYLPTSANATYQMLFAHMQQPQVFDDVFDAWGNPSGNQVPDIVDEAKWGLDWLVKMNPEKGNYYNQIADDRDHAGMRLPTRDSVIYAPGKGLARPVYFISGQSQGEKYKNRTRGVASSAGKFASAFALGAIRMQGYYPEFAGSLRQKAIDAFVFGEAYPGNTQTISVKSPYIYAEDNYVDDMQLAALSLYQLTGDPAYLQSAIRYARQEPVTPWMGADSASHYQWYPFVNLGHYWGARLDSAHRDEYLDFMRQGIQRVVNRGRNSPFLNGVPFIWCSNNLVVGILTQMHLYRQLTGDNTYIKEEAALRDWLFGCNPWGTAMICDLPASGTAPKDPHSAFTHLYGYKIPGGLVDGPVYGSIWNKLIGIQLYHPDEFAPFQSDRVVYHDDFGDYATNEPTMDGTASLSYYLSALQQEAVPKDTVYDTEGGMIRLGGTSKNVYLIFSAHEYADGAATVLQTLQQYKVKGNFFLTGDFLRNPEFQPYIQKMVQDGHYVGSHSDKHLLYADWSNRDSLLVSRDSFRTDFNRAIGVLSQVTGQKPGRWYLSPYEWYNKKTVEWCRSEGAVVINFTPGTGTNADYTWPGMKNYRSSRWLLNHLFEFESDKGLSGAFLLIHLGTDSRRKDKLYNQLGTIIKKLKLLGYHMERLPD